MTVRALCSPCEDGTGRCVGRAGGGAPCDGFDSVDWFGGKEACPACGHICFDHAACRDADGCRCHHPCHVSAANEDVQRWDEPTFWRKCVKCRHNGWTVRRPAGYVCPLCVSLSGAPSATSDQAGQIQ